MGLSERFPALTPIALRREKAREVFLLIARFNVWSRKQAKSMKNGKKIIRKPAGDNWF